ncbi:MAG: ATP-binding protein, partial [Chloroflexota bacterium]
KLFTPYYRGEDSNRKEQTPGLGLGLSISKSLVELHKGEIWVDSKAGEGNIFAFSLPALQQRVEETS